jgi:hypothetical protein
VGVLGRWTRWIIVIGAAAAAIVGAVGWYVYDGTGPRDAGAAGEQLRADMRTLTSELELREVTPDTFDGTPAAGEECGIWQGGEDTTQGPHVQHQISLEALPPSGREVSGLRPDAERILRRLGYRIITDDVDFVAPPPAGYVIASWGRNGLLQITLWPEPESGTVQINGSARCLPAG